MNKVDEFKSEVEERLELNEADKAFQNDSNDWRLRAMEKKYVYNFEWMGRPIIQFPQDILAMQQPFHGSSLDPWLQDHLVNSLSHMRTAMWFDKCPNCHKTEDTRSKGFWRQWEAFDCPDLDSIHNDGERHLSYIMFWPNTTLNKLAAWAGNQGANGMLAEQIHNAILISLKAG